MVEQTKATPVKPKSASTKAQRTNPASEQHLAKEQERNDWLKLEMARVVAESRFDLVKQITTGGYYLELKRQKKESDERLSILRRPGQLNNVASTSSRTKREMNGRDPDGHVARRRKLVRNNPDASAAELCEIFERAGLPVLDSHAKKPWPDLYKTHGYKSRIDTLIAKDRKLINQQN